MKVLHSFLLLLGLISGLKGASKEHHHSKGTFVIPPAYEKSQIKVKEIGDIDIIVDARLKKPQLIIDGEPRKMTTKALQELFEPCSLSGNYDPIVDFFYKKLPYFSVSFQEPAVKWLESINNDPVIMYLYLRHCAETFTVKEYAAFSYNDIVNFWIKRYVAEILFKIDKAALNLSKEDPGQHAASERIDIVLERYIEKLDGFMKGFESAKFSRISALKTVILVIKKMFLGENEEGTEIPWHGASQWLLTTNIGSSFSKYVTLGLAGGSHFTYGSLKEIKDQASGLNLKPKNQEKLYAETREIVRNMLLLLAKEVQD